MVASRITGAAPRTRWPIRLFLFHPHENELLGALAVLHLRRVEVAFGVRVHVVEHVELAGRHAGPAERVEGLERLAVEHPDARGAAARDVEKPLLAVVREGRAGNGLAVAAMGRLAPTID